MPSGPPPSLKPRQIDQIIRDRLAGFQYKQIALRVGCTPDQAIHYWRNSTAYKPQGNRAASAKRREAMRAAVRRERMERINAQRRIDGAKAALQAEIARAIAERDKVPLYKPGALEWGT